MSTATSDTATRDAERYLKDVAPHLAALPAEERADLLDDLAQHLREIAAEPGPTLSERLGSPEAYAAELLASAGVVPDGRTGRPLLGQATALIDRGRASWVGQEVIRAWPALQPAWWVVRGYLAVSLVAAIGLGGSWPGFPLPHLAGNPALGLLGILAAIPVSVRLGQGSLSRTQRLAVVGADVVLVLFALSLLGRAGAPEVHYVDYSGVGERIDANRGCLTNGQGQRITNLYGYDVDGRLLDPVLLYDQNGSPIDDLCPEVDERGRRLTNDYRQDINGAPVINAFPRRQTAVVSPPRPSFGPGSAPQTEATVPVRPPPVVVPRLTPTTGVTTTTTPGAPAG